MTNRNDLRKGRIPERATMNGDFVIDVSDFLYNPHFEDDSMVTANDLLHNGVDVRLFNSDRLYPVYDAKNGMSIGSMKPRDFMRKMLGDF